MEKTRERARKMKGRERAVFLICLINGLCAVFFGGLMMLFPTDTPLGLSEMLPSLSAFPLNHLFFQDLFWSGLALLLCNGVCNLAAVYLFLKRHPAAFSWAKAAGLLLMIWCVVELAFFPNPAAVFYWVVGLVQLYVASSAGRRHSIHAW